MSETETGTLSVGLWGTIVNKDGTPVENVSIIANELSQERSDTVLTNGEGLYNFTKLRSGNYYLEGQYLLDTLLVNTFIDTIQYDSLQYVNSAYNLGTDTLLLPGVIEGYVKTQESHHKGVLIFIDGTSHNAYSDSNGYYKMIHIPADSGYNMTYHFDGYTDTTLNDITLNADDTLTMPTVLLSLNPDLTPPAPQDINAEYDSSSRAIKVSWKPVDHPGLGGYLLYRKDSTDTALDPELISGTKLLSDTIFVDETILLYPGESKTVQYQLRSQHKTKGNKSDLSDPVYITIRGHEVVVEHMKLISASGQQFVQGLASIVDESDTSSRPQRVVRFTYDYYMDSCEVTQGAYKEAMTGTFGYDDHKIPTWNSMYGNDKNHPAYWVSWFDAVLYCNAISKRDGLDTVYEYTALSYPNIHGPESGAKLDELKCDISKNGYRLPTEAEWEFAARAGSTSDFYWGANLPFPESSADTILCGELLHWGVLQPDSLSKIMSPVGKYKANAFGLYDMTGNLFELCADQYNPTEYSNGDQTDPYNSETEGFVVLRGGSYNGTKFQLLRTGRRAFTSRSTGSRDYGFRTVRTVTN